jgi:ABC-type nitrate/sulfonate/bicarbonate transport system substrate-binding protein
VRRAFAALALVVLVLSLGGCAQKSTSVSGGATATETVNPLHQPGNENSPFKMVGKDKVYLHAAKTYDPAKFPKTAMTGEPSNIPFFKPTKDEGIVNRDYPSFDKKTFKFLALPTAAIPPQDYYMFPKNGGTLNAALKGTGYKAADIIDTGHIKILPNLYTGYYDFAWVPLAVMTEYWSGNESMNQELWRDGNDYVVIGSSTDGDSSLIAPPDVTDLKQLAGNAVGIMNVSFNTEALFNKKLNTVGMATESAGGTVKIETGTPGYVMNDVVGGKLNAVFSWSVYTRELLGQQHFHELVKWQDLGYGNKVTNVVLVVRKDILAKHPGIVQKVVQLNYDATQQALTVGDYAKPGAKRYQDWINTYLGVPQRVSDLGVPNLDPTVNEPMLRDVYDYMVKCGYFKTPYKFGELVNTSFQDKIAK